MFQLSFVYRFLVAFVCLWSVSCLASTVTLIGKDRVYVGKTWHTESRGRLFIEFLINMRQKNKLQKRVRQVMQNTSLKHKRQLSKDTINYIVSIHYSLYTVAEQLIVDQLASHRKCTITHYQGLLPKPYGVVGLIDHLVIYQKFSNLYTNEWRNRVVMPGT